MTSNKRIENSLSVNDEKHSGKSDENKQKYYRKQSKGAIKASLIKQLSAKNALVPHFIALVDDYMEFYSLSEKLKKDISVRGLSIKQQTATGIEQQKENPSVRNLISVNRQMISILAQMELTTNKPTGEVIADDTGL